MEKDYERVGSTLFAIQPGESERVTEVDAKKKRTERKRERVRCERIGSAPNAARPLKVGAPGENKLISVKEANCCFAYSALRVERERCKFCFRFSEFI